MRGSATLLDGHQCNYCRCNWIHCHLAWSTLAMFIVATYCLLNRGHQQWAAIWTDKKRTMLGVSAASCAILLCLTWSPEKTLFTKPPDQETADYDALTPKVLSFAHTRKDLIYKYEDSVARHYLTPLWLFFFLLPFLPRSWVRPTPVLRLALQFSYSLQQGSTALAPIRRRFCPQIVYKTRYGPARRGIFRHSHKGKPQLVPFFCFRLNLGICFICGQWRYK